MRVFYYAPSFDVKAWDPISYRISWILPRLHLTYSMPEKPD